MNRKLMVAAVAAAFVAPTAFAQSSVTISGLFKGGVENSKLGSSAKNPSGQGGVVDDSSRIVFNVVEDLGGGMSAVGQVDVRIKLDDPRIAASPQDVNGLIGQGNTHVGLRSTSWGRIIVGRQDLHYFNTESNISDKASLRANSISLLSFIGGLPIAGATRTQNVVQYLSPNWSGFTVIAAYSSNPNGAETDVNTGVRRGRAWNLNPNFAGANWQVGYSYWTAKNDGAISVTCPAVTVSTVNGVPTPACGVGGVTSATVAPDQRADRLYGSYVFPMGLKIGLAWDKSRLKNAITGADLNNRNAWSLPVSYTFGPHALHVNYTRAGNDKVAAAGANGAKMWALAYSYDLSKRTSAALTYSRINNNAAGTYNFFTGTSLGISPAVSPGEDPRMYGLTLRHVF